MVELVSIVTAERGTYIERLDKGHREIVLAWLHIVDEDDNHYVMSAIAIDMEGLNNSPLKTIVSMIRKRMDSHRIVTAGTRQF